MVYCHPRPESFNAAVLDTVTRGLAARGAEVRVRDLYRDGFEPALGARELEVYLDEAANQAPVAEHVADLRWCDALVFVYPTWWYGPPAVLKGWLDRVMLPGVAFHMPAGPGEQIRPALTHVRRLAVFTTCGASRLWTAMVGAPGRRILMRGLRSVCARRCRTTFAAHYLMDSSTPASREAHLALVARRVAAL